MEQFRFRWSAANVNEGASWVALGLFFKLCLADNLAGFFDGASVSNAYLIWMNNLLFGLRIYYDFAGYSLVALGLARCLGVKLTLNFLQPLLLHQHGGILAALAHHLSQWFRDYLYIPLGGGRVRWWAFNLAVVFVVSGIWHGAGWNFVLWGAIHGVALIINRLWSARSKLPAFFAWLLTMLTSFWPGSAFMNRARRVLALKMKTLFTPAPMATRPGGRPSGQYLSPDGLVLACFLALTGVILLLEWLSIARHDEPFYFLRRPAVTAVLVVLTVVLAPEKNNGFIYFAF